MFLDLAHLFGEKEVVKARWQEFLDYEETIMNDLAVRGDRIH
jgi:tRNA-(ms[2]io[6]A)-hydroxylase